MTIMEGTLSRLNLRKLFNFFTTPTNFNNLEPELEGEYYSTDHQELVKLFWLEH